MPWNWGGGGGTGVAPQPLWGVWGRLEGPQGQSQSCPGAQEPPAPTADGTEPCAGKEIFPKSAREGRPLSTSGHCVTLCHFVTSPVTDAESPFQPLCFLFLGKVMEIVLLRLDKVFPC